MAINRASIAFELLPGLNKIYGTAYAEVPIEHEPLFETESSERAFEEEVLWTGFGTAPIKEEGAAVQYDESREMWKSRYTHDTIALAFAFTEEAMEDNLYDTFSKVRSKGLGRAMAATKQIKAAAIFNNGFSSSYLGGDGVALFSSSHPTVGGGNQSNTATSDLSETALENELIQTSLIQDDRGILVGANAVLLAIPPQLQFVATRILKGTERTGTANRDINAIKNMGLLSQGYVINRRFTDAGGWFLKNDIGNCTKHFVRMKPSTKMEGDFDTGNLRFKARERYSFGWSEWRGWRGST